MTRDIAAVDAGGWWAVVATYEGETVLRQVRRRPPGQPHARLGRGRDPGSGRGSHRSPASSTSRRSKQVRELIAAGHRVPGQRLPGAVAPRRPIRNGRTWPGFAALLAAGNPAPYSGFVRLPAGSHPALADGLHVATASPEPFLRRSGPAGGVRTHQGTARTAAGLTDKDRAENVMIVDLVRIDLGVGAAPAR